MTAARSIGARMGDGRPADDFYPTPRGAVEALLGVESFDGQIWEPACGDGAISTVLVEHGHTVWSTDLHDRGFGLTGQDFLALPYDHPNIVTNPPFRLAEAFVQHGLKHAEQKLCLLLRLQFLEGQRRKKTLYDVNPPSRVHVFSNRLSMKRESYTGTNGGLMCFAWFVWDKDIIGPTELNWITA